MLRNRYDSTDSKNFEVVCENKSHKVKEEMNMKKQQILAGCLAAVMLAACGTTVLAETLPEPETEIIVDEAAESDFVIDENGVLTGYTGAGGDVVIPAGVKEIGDEAFRHCSNLTGVVIPDSVESIGDLAFQYCENLTSVMISDGVTKIGASAFGNCSSLKNIVLPDTITDIGSRAFESSGLTRITIPNSMDYIPMGAFAYCHDLVNVVIPDSVTSIGGAKGMFCYGAFENCTSLKNITIPDSVQYIGYHAFHNTEWLNQQPNGIVYAGKFAYAYKGDESQLTTVDLADGIKGIAEGAFENCTNLTSITIPDGVTSIGSDAFYGCSSLASIALPDSVQKFGARVLDETAWYHNQPEGILYIGKVAYGYKGNKSGLITIDLAEGTKIIADYAFAFCENLDDLKIPDSVIHIGLCSFQRCSNLTSVIIPSNVTEIEVAAFNFCDALTSVTILNSKTKIGRAAFDGCDTLTIYGYSGSTAEVYANENNIPFAALTTPGDLNGDANTDISDLMLLAQVVNGRSSLTDEQIRAADVTGDGKADIADLMKIAQFVNGRIDSLN